MLIGRGALMVHGGEFRPYDRVYTFDTRGAHGLSNADTSTGFDVSADGTYLLVCLSSIVRRSADSGSSWASVISSGNWQSVLFPRTTAQAFAFTNPGALRSSTDYGATFASVGTSQAFHTSASCSTDASILYQASSSGYPFKSTNGGTTWSNLTAFTSGQYRATACSEDGNIFYAAINASSTPVQCSLDGGSTRSYVSDITVGNYYKGLACSADGSIVYASSTNGAVYKSTNYGVNFTLIHTNGGAPRKISCDDTGKYVVMAGSPWEYSEDGGASWKQGSFSTQAVCITPDGTYCYALSATTCYRGTLVRA